MSVKQTILGMQKSIYPILIWFNLCFSSHESGLTNSTNLLFIQGNCQHILLDNGIKLFHSAPVCTNQDTNLYFQWKDHSAVLTPPSSLYVTNGTLFSSYMLLEI